MRDISGRRSMARSQACLSVTGSSTATTWGRLRRIACRTSIANSSRPGTTGKYVNRPRCRLPGSGNGRPVSPGIAQGFLSQHLDHRNFKRLGFVCPLGGQALHLDREARDVDAVTHGVALVRSVRHLEEIGDVIQDSFLGEGQVLPKDLM